MKEVPISQRKKLTVTTPLVLLVVPPAPPPPLLAAGLGEDEGGETLVYSLPTSLSSSAAISVDSHAT
jgi:hypothetical protein